MRENINDLYKTYKRVVDKNFELLKENEQLKKEISELKKKLESKK